MLEDSQRFFIPGVDGDLIAFNINGRSMEPTISNGDMVICSPIEHKDLTAVHGAYTISNQRCKINNYLLESAHSFSKNSPS